MAESKVEETQAKDKKMPELDKKIMDYAKSIMAKNKKLAAVYVVDGLIFTDKQFAEGRSFLTGSHLYELKK